MTLGAAAAAVLLTFADARITESSALASSAAGDWLWTANDSGDSARLFAVGPDGRTRTVARLPDTQVVDVEDLAVGPGGTLYVADIGDNDAVRPSVRVLRVPEPRLDGPSVTTARPAAAVLTYEDGPHDAETLLVHPRTGQVLVVTKSVFGSAVYAAPQPFGSGVLHRVGRTLPLRDTGTTGGPRPQFAARLLATGGAVSPDGTRLVVRTYTDAYVWDVPGDDLVAALAGAPTVVPLPATEQGEAVTWARDGQALLTSSEGRRAPVHLVPLPTSDRARPAPTGQPDTRPPAAAQPAPAAQRRSVPYGALAGAAIAGIWVLVIAARRRSRR